MAATTEQRVIIEALGFEVGEDWKPETWYPGAFSEDGIDVVIRDLPYLPEVNEILKGVGFRWDPDSREWIGADSTERQVQILQALAWCRGRYYPGGTRDACPVKVGAYGA